MDEGMRLARGPWARLCEDLVDRDEYRASLTAHLLENTYQYMHMVEDTRVANVGVFDKFAMPIIRAVMPNLIATDIVSVQPMDGPVSLIFFLATRYAATKGTATAGQEVQSPLSGHNSQYQYTGEVIDEELLGTGDGSTAAITLTSLTWLPIRPGSITVSTTIGSSASTASDDGVGNLTGTDVSSGTINYTTGAIAITWSTAPDADAVINATYAYNSEGNATLPQIDIHLTQAPVTARANKLRARWSVEAAADLKAVHNLDAEAELMAFLAEELRFEIDRGIIQDLYNVADAGAVADWDPSPPTNVSDYQHRLTFPWMLTEASNVIFQRTKRAAANWLVAGVEMCNIIETLPNFRPSAISGPGIVHLGNLQGRWEVYKDPWMADPKRGILGYRGTSFADTGYVYAPYVPLYRTPTIYLDDMIGRVGLMSRYGKKLVNDDFYMQVGIV
jgi:hypothetical protein